MKRYKYYHQKFLHYGLTKFDINQEQFQVLTSLDDEDLEYYLSLKRSKLCTMIHMMGTIVKYQESKKNNTAPSWLIYRNVLPQELSLLSDVFGLYDIPLNAEIDELGLSLLSVVNRRQAVLCSLRLKKSMPDIELKVKSPERLRFFIKHIISKKL
ncbi:hypothetical protein [Vibrio aestuarianus]|uniref:Uncharacterized protein n=1 Tax=Vibrio aestuarianus TaxID=28171 RepID=A0ABD7YR77_9VIBR|nr:hypothetical protein [Vibrio aestuarianus]WGK86923.1 hypothetical protein PYE67_18455 [Vibrio aestuarianus]CAH8232862.1 conserved hypothetical protein [Vibrio aestuarianus]